ncbi:LysR family transcriptional regulator [Ensifer adhaerens]|uniref:LysR family transcriptional regulator n=1 Tax=Ensifer adhaerens TaxID=106592 RepID=UPI001CD025F9|nr:LysR family transcriptional regulator [Ensifer adhaerens]MBZ7926649.1 LysR family transcriptional regulator [Ensifer adhaerens]
MRDIHNLDLNLIRIFNAVLDERGVTKAADRLHVTQSAISHALARLREVIGDELFIRGPDGMHPTPRAMELSQSFKPALRQIEAAICEPVFDPATSDMEFSVATSDYITATTIADFMARLRARAPNARCRVRSLSEMNIAEELDRGSIHVAIGVFGKTPTRFVREPFFSDRSVWLMRKDHPAATGAFGLRELSMFPHVDILISNRSEAHGGGTIDEGGLERAHITSNPRHIEGLLDAQGLARRVGTTVSHILVVPSLVAPTDMIAFTPLRLAERAARALDLVWREPPYETPPLEVSMLSHRTMGAHPSVRWLRHELIESSRSYASDRHQIVP